MKFYNPWKPHIVKDGWGYYYIRKLNFGWVYFNGKDWNWDGLWKEPYGSYTSAKKAIEEIKQKRLDTLDDEAKSKNIKVIHD